MDWMLVEAWNVEHNQLHHYHLGEIDDPDLVEHNLAFLRVSPMPKPLKYIAVTVMAMIWKVGIAGSNAESAQPAESLSALAR